MNGLKERVGSGYVAIPILVALRGARAPGAAGDRDAAWTERIAAAARLDADGAAALREWLNDAAPAAGADDARLACGDAIPTDILEPYRFEPDARAFFDDAFRECLNRWSRRLLEQDGATWLSDVVLVPFLVAAARARESAPSCEARSIRALADAFGADLRRLLDASRVLDDGDIGDIGAMRASLECVTSFRDGLLHADRRLSNGAPAACRPQVCAAAYEDLEAAVLRRFDASANARAGRRPRYLAFVGGEDRDLPERLVERIVRQGEPRNGGGTGVEPPRIVIPRADAAPADDSAQPDPAAAFGVDAIDDVLPVCVLSGVDDAAAIRRLRALLVRGAHAAVVLACHGLPAASAALPDAWAAARPARMLRLLGFGAARDAQAFLVDMAADGLFARTPPIGYPRASRARRATLGEFEARDYRVRPAAPHDLPALQALELACWPAALRMPEATLAARVGRHAAGQFVLELDAREAAAGPRRLAGVIYSQRIASVRALDGVDADTVDRLHEDGGPVIQLLAVNVDPACQSRRLGDQLLEFMLQRCAALADVESLVAVTLCRDFHKHASMPIDDYLRLRNAFGFLADPILRFHELHGARIERPMPGYRPRDARNAGFGVLVSYDLARRARNEAGTRAPPRRRAPSGTRRRPRTRTRWMLSSRPKSAASWAAAPSSPTPAICR